MIEHIKTIDQFKSLINKENVLVDFYTSWCGPCKMLSPIIEELADEDPDLVVLKVDAEEVSELAINYQIQAVPTLFHFRNGVLVDKLMGYQNKEVLKDFVSK